MSASPQTDRNAPDSGVGRASTVVRQRSGKLARRARSFKEDFLEILSQMRSPAPRSGSPVSPRSRTAKNAGADTVDATSCDRNPLRDLDAHVRQVQFALKHFRDVVAKDKLEMLPGNGTVVLETVTTIHGVLKSYVLNEQSSTLVSATNQVYQSLAKLIKLCDDVLLHGDKSLNKESAVEVVRLVEEAVQNLVSLAQDKIVTRESNRLSRRNPATTDRTSSYSVSLVDPPLRSSLPDIPLTPRERLILAQTSASVLDRHSTLDRHSASDSGTDRNSVAKSQSEESILIDGSPPPKPPLPWSNRFTNSPPPLPPKRRNRPVDQLITSDFDSSSLTDTLNSSSNSVGVALAASLERISLRSKSPEDTSSLLSASAGSLDSVLNHSREEEEIQALMDPVEETQLSNENILQGGIIALNGTNNSCCCWDSAPTETGRGSADKNSISLFPLLGQTQDLSCIAPGSIIGAENMTSLSEPPSLESGFASMRSSTQSYTASSSVYSRSSQQSTFSSSDSATGKTWQRSSATTEANFSRKVVSTSSESVSTFSQRTESKASTVTAVEGSFSPTRDALSPPALPEKTRSRRGRDREVSQYDNMPGASVTVMETSSSQHRVGCAAHDSKPPPLPLKKKHMFQSVAYSVMAYMEMFGNCSHQNNNEFLRHSVHTYNMMQAEWQQNEMALTSTQSCSFSMVSSTSGRTLAPNSHLNIEELSSTPALPPALPPKRSRTASVRSASSPPPPLSPPPPTPSKLRELAVVTDNHVGEVKPSRVEATKPPLHRLESKPASQTTKSNRESKHADAESDSSSSDVNPLEELDVMRHLVTKKPEEDGPEVRGGHPDALIIHATKANKNDFLYQEAFLTTYRTFLSPLELIRKLCRRHERFSCSSDLVKQRAAREAFSLLVRVVSDLTLSDLSEVVQQTLMDFVYQLLCSGDLTMAKALRVKILEKCEAKKSLSTTNTLLSSLNITTRQSSLLDFKSEQIAEQMTLLDANLFMKIEIPEVLIWAQEQNEERSPNLTRFTEHFNKMSYWARSRILEQNEAKDRERYVVKFIKIMKHLRKINNFNSYLALLSALDSAPIRRLEWQKHITEGLKEYCALIDSSSSFRAYRQALAETQPPCIPYIGLVLQDLTFVHIGNSDLLADGSINFSKRWQQFNIVENMKRFKKGTYTFKKHERIIAFFNTFDDYLCEESMWQISESIKPRGGKKVT